MSANDLRGIGPGTIETLLRSDTFAGVVIASDRAGFAGSKARSFSAFTEKLVDEVGIDAAFDFACHVFNVCASREAWSRTVLLAAVSHGRGPKRVDQPLILNPLFHSDGRPTVMGNAVLARLAQLRRPPSMRLPPASPPGPKKLPKNSEIVLPYMDLRRAKVPSIERLLSHVPEYRGTEYKRLVENTIGAIHQIPRLHRSVTGERIELKQIEAYFGRSSGTSANLAGRWRAGLDRGHEHGMVFARCSVKASLGYERHGIMLLDVLKEVGGLCISNRSMKAVGRVGTSEPGFLYMTFRIEKAIVEAPGRTLSREQIARMVADHRKKLSELARDSGVAVPELERAMRDGLIQANNPSDFGGYKLTPHAE